REGGRQLSAIVRVDEEAGLAMVHDLFGGAPPGGEDGFAGPHRLQVDEAEALAPAGHDEGGATPVELGERRLADEAGEGDYASDAEGGRLRLQAGAVVAVACDHQPGFGVLGEKVRQRFQELIVPFITLAGGHASGDEEEAASEPVEQPGIRRSRGLALLQRQGNDGGAAEVRAERQRALQRMGRNGESRRRPGQSPAAVPIERPPDLDSVERQEIRRPECSGDEGLNPRRPQEIEDVCRLAIRYLFPPHRKGQGALIAAEAAGGDLEARRSVTVEREQAEADPPLAGERGTGAGQEPAGRGAAAAVQSQAGGDEDEIAARAHGGWPGRLRPLRCTSATTPRGRARRARPERIPPPYPAAAVRRKGRRGATRSRSSSAATDCRRKVTETTSRSRPFSRSTVPVHPRNGPSTISTSSPAPM